jgi:hypothetical protein
MSVPFSSCCPSGRVIWIETGLKAPAFALAGPAAKVGEKGRSARVFGHLPPVGLLLRVKLLLRVTGGLPDHGVITALALLGPQVGGLLSTARAPPLKVRSKEVNGTCGVSAIVVLSWPVTGSARTLPTSRTAIP